MKLWVMSAVLAATPAAAGEPARLIGITQAVAVAERATGGKATDAELDDQGGGRLAYEIALVRGQTIHEVEVDARSGHILRQRTPRLASYWARWFAADELRHIAHARPLSRILGDLERHSGGIVLEASFEVAAGRPRYDVKISTRAGVADIYLDPGTGARLALAHDD